jgi:hypothetical protein
MIENVAQSPWLPALLLLNAIEQLFRSAAPSFHIGSIKGDVPAELVVGASCFVIF